MRGLAALGHGRAEVTGTLRFAASSSFAQLYIAPILPEFLRRYPGVNLELKLSDTQIDLIEGGFDLALRNYAIEDSSLRARKLAPDRRILCASPSYIAKRGDPKSPDDLVDHELIAFAGASARELSHCDGAAGGQFPPQKAQPRVVCDDGASSRIVTKAGAGISMSSLWIVCGDLKDGSLVRVLPDHEVDDQSAIWLVYPKSNVLTAKVRVFIDFLLEQVGDPPVWERFS